MVCVDNNVSDVVAGYDQIIAGNTTLAVRQLAPGRPSSPPQPPVEIAPETRQRPTWLITLAAAAAIGLAALAALAALIVVPRWIGPDDPSRLAAAYTLIVVALLVFSAIVVVLAIGVWLWLGRQRSAPSVATLSSPPPPLARPAATVSAPPPPLLPRWRAAMSASLPPPKSVAHHGDPGAEDYPGVYALVGRLAALPQRDAFPPYVLCGVRPNRSSNFDTIVVERRGIWLFEVKYWSGRVTWRNSRWEHVTVDPHTGVEAPAPHRPWPDEQWQRLVGEIQLILDTNARDVVARYPRIAEIQGGIVLAHPTAELDISSGIPIFTGRIEEWLTFYPRVRGLVSLDERAALEVVEALLTRHKQVIAQETGSPPPRRSMLAEANRLLARA